MKKLTLSCALLTSLGLSSVASAGLFFDGPIVPYNGFYGTIAVGGVNGLFNVDQRAEFEAGLEGGDFTFGDIGSITAASARTGIVGGSKADLYGTSWIGLIGVGYRQCVADGFVLGLEFTADIQNPKGTDEFYNVGYADLNDVIGDPVEFDFSDLEARTFVAGETTAKVRNSLGLVAKGGFLVGPRTLVYGLVGVRWGNTKVTSSAIWGGELELDEVPVDADFDFDGFYVENSKSGYTAGVTAGLGMEHYVSDCFSLALEWAYSNYGTVGTPTFEGVGIEGSDLSFQGPLVTASADRAYAALENHNSKVKVQQNMIFARLNYTFN